MHHLFILTSAFPYEGGEQFLETEIEFWNSTKFNKVWIIPEQSSGKMRDIPHKIKVLPRKLKKSRCKYLLSALINPILYREISYIFRNIELKHIPQCLITALKSTALTLKALSELKDILKQFSEDKITIYSYWNDISSYAACLLKRKGLVKKVVSRAHGFDLYQERRPAKYMSLKRQFVNDYDEVFLLSNSSLDYYQKTYTINKNNLNIARLGVDIPSITRAFVPSSDTLRILSLSYCVPIKQVDLIMSAVESYSFLNPKKTVFWTHIGDGPLFDGLSAKASSLVGLYPNLKVNFVGHLENRAVKKHLATTKYDVMINASKSEGIPVSIMEAMSYGIPTVAPDIGGISDLVNNENGFLMPSVCSKEDIIRGIEYICNTEYALNENAHSWVSKHFNSSVNYPKFIATLEDISRLHETE